MKSAIQLMIVLAGILSLSTAAAFGDDKGDLSDEQKQLMSQLDIDQDGVISESEAQRHPELAQRFRELDKNRDQVLEQAEFARFEVDDEREEDIPPRES
ncbi:MAG: hypothetical protein WDZ60_05490 [Wenzhouxiangellaceae bacterium]